MELPELLAIAQRLHEAVSQYSHVHGTPAEDTDAAFLCREISETLEAAGVAIRKRQDEISRRIAMRLTLAGVGQARGQLASATLAVKIEKPQIPSATAEPERFAEVMAWLGFPADSCLTIHYKHYTELLAAKAAAGETIPPCVGTFDTVATVSLRRLSVPATLNSTH